VVVIVGGTRQGNKKKSKSRFMEGEQYKGGV